MEADDKEDFQNNFVMRREEGTGLTIQQSRGRVALFMCLFVDQVFWAG